MKKPSTTYYFIVACLASVLFGSLPALAQDAPDDRIRFNDQDLWLNGGNVAWFNFARDIGPGTTQFDEFEEMFQEVHAYGGNAMRIWLHTSGESTPEWDGAEVVGPGAGAIEDLRAILDVAWQHEVGMVLCLWSFNMLEDRPAQEQAYGLLTDQDLLQTYIDNALIPVVEALADHPAIIAWEIFNEPEGMSTQFGWTPQRVPMADIQRFVNRTAGAIHRADPDALVTNGAWNMRVLTDVPTLPAAKAAPADPAVLQTIRREFAQKHTLDFSLEQAQAYYDQLQTAAGFNYYTDERLIDVGGDPDGFLDFYTVHYYTHFPISESPFHQPYSYWELDKPLVVAEFYLPESTFGVPYGSLYTALFNTGYAGALAWQYFDWWANRTDVDGQDLTVNWPRALENMATIYEQHPEAVDVEPRVYIVAFSADPEGIEAGQSSDLSWSVVGAETITLDGETVDSIGTQTVSPEETTTYTLEATGRGDSEVIARQVTVIVLDPDQVNRARTQPAVASTIETCCGSELTANLAFDGDANTRWSSEWQDGFADDDPDDEWIYVDLGAAYRIHEIVLDWEAAFGSAYRIDVSYDAQVWTTVYEETNGDGGIDVITFEEPPSGRFVRMYGVVRGTQYGYSLWEFEVYGLPSELQPPEIALSAPTEGAIVIPGTDVTVTADASDPDGTVQHVVFYIDGELAGEATAAPFAFTWTGVSEGEHTLSAIATDDDGIAVSSSPFEVFATDTGAFARYEFEDATFEGDMSIESTTPGASGGSYLYMRDNGTVTFDNVVADQAGQYLLTFDYYLPFGYKAQYLYINGEQVAEVGFDGPTEQWLERAVNVQLQAGANTIMLEKNWGWMYFDTIGLSTGALNVAHEGPDEVPAAFALGQNHPNPFNPETVIAYRLRDPVHVQLEVFDVTGRRVAVLVDGVQATGAHAARFNAQNLASGIYFYQIRAGAFTETKRMVLMR